MLGRPIKVALLTSYHDKCVGQMVSCAASFVSCLAGQFMYLVIDIKSG